MAFDYPGLLSDLQAESDTLLEVLGELTPGQWSAPTPAARWAIRDQVSHLAFFDDSARSAITDPDRFVAESSELMQGGMDFPDRIAVSTREIEEDRLLAWFTKSRTALLEVLQTTHPRLRVPWYGPNMSVASSATARLMETWAHGRDIYDALGIVPEPSPGLRSIAHLGVSTFGFAHEINGRAVPTDPVRVELQSPNGEVWTWGEPDALNKITGPAEQFALVVTQRANVEDTDLTVDGAVATGWMEIAQAYAGAPGTGRPASTMAAGERS